MRSILISVIIFTAFQNLQCLKSNPYARLNFFDIDLLRYAADGQPGNVVLSPASVKSTLAMLLEGAKGITAAEIKSTLRLSPTKDDFRNELSVYLKALEVNVTGTITHSANGLFAANKLKLRKEYATILKEVYSTNINSLNFTDSSASVKFINDWVNLETKGLIPTIVEEVHVNPSSEMIVANALYFKSSWVHTFDPKQTHKSCFYVHGICNTVAMMELQAELDYAYVDGLRAHAVELPYKGDRYSMILLMPQDRAAELALIRDLPYVGLPKISELMEPSDVILSLPKFNVDYNDDLADALKKTGIKSLFSWKSNLSGIFEGPSPYLNSIYHSVNLEVNEGGTVAASTTGGLVIPLINNQVQLRVDRPFLFFIRDNELGLIVFEGKITEPTEYIEDNVMKDEKKHQISNEVPMKTQVSSMEPKKPQVSNASLNKTEIAKETLNKTQIANETLNKTQIAKEAMKKTQAPSEEPKKEPVPTKSPQTLQVSSDTVHQIHFPAPETYHPLEFSYPYYVQPVRKGNNSRVYGSL